MGVGNQVGYFDTPFLDFTSEPDCKSHGASMCHPAPELAPHQVRTEFGRKSLNVKMGLPQNIWMFWEQGDAAISAPPLNKECFSMWRTLNPSWAFHLLTTADVANMFPEIAELFTSSPRLVEHRSDLLRLLLLAKFGGVWADASLLPLKSLDDFANQVVAETGFFAYSTQGDNNDMKIGNYFMVAKPNNPLVCAWRDAFIDKWKKLHDFGYSEVQHTLKQLIADKDQRVIGVWRHEHHVPQSWVRQCEKGCPHFWQTIKPEDRPPVLKRPYASLGKHGPGPPLEWMKMYRASLGPW